MKLFALAVIVLAAACGCPSNESGRTNTESYTHERDAACAAVTGCNVLDLMEIPVYESANPEEDGCDNEAVGCFCTNPGCPGVILVSDHDVTMPSCIGDAQACTYTKELIALHEYVHAAFRSTGVDTSKHGPAFDQALARAFEVWSKR